MTGRRLTPEEQALWAKVTATVHPFGTTGLRRPRAQSNGSMQNGSMQDAPLPPPLPVKVVPSDRETLDRTWDRRISSGKIGIDATIDLHGMTREAARTRLHELIFRAARNGMRTILAITGKGGNAMPAPADLMPGLGGTTTPRGSIRAEVARWLAEPAVSPYVAAVRRAHPRHGGQGAIYIVIRRRRG